MAFQIRPVEYFNVSVKDRRGAAYELLTLLAGQGVDLLAFAAVSCGEEQTQLSVFPDDAQKLVSVARKSGLEFDGPHRALLVRGDDEIGALAGIHERLGAADVHVFSSIGIADGEGGYGYVVYVRPEEFDRAVAALED